MASTLYSYLPSLPRWRSSTPPAPEKESAMRALPSNWYTSPEMYELERRAIFSRKWMPMTHISRLQKPGDFLNFTVAEYKFIINRDRQGNIKGHHNVCRHRAFPVVTANEGNAQIFSCKYHGWSYGLDGRLAKAPGYQELDGFKKEENGLMPIHVHVDVNGFIYVNLDGKKVPEISWEDDWKEIDRQERYSQYNFDDYVFDHTWSMEGPYNWKILADNYNECYHCATSHPDIGAVANLESYSVDTEGTKIIHDAATTDEQRKLGLNVSSTYYFPNASTNITPHFFMIQRFVPHSYNKCSMEYQVFRSKHATDEQFDLVNNIYKRVMSEDKYLCDLAQKNLNAGVFVNGELHPKFEKGPLFFQKVVRETVTEHWEKEQKAKQEIWPAKQIVEGGTKEQSRKDSDFCEGLSCSNVPETFAW